MLSTASFQAHSKLLLSALYSNVSGDPPITIYRILNALWSAMSIPIPGVARRTAVALLDETAVEHLLKLTGREEKESTTGRSVAEMTGAFLEAVTTIPGKGICFPDEGWYPRRIVEDGVAPAAAEEDEDKGGVGDAKDAKRKGLHNRILSNVVKRLGNKVIDDGGVGDWVVKVLNSCPELIAR
jgi:nucleolar pre-ribosomal-associated protein 1